MGTKREIVATKRIVDDARGELGNRVHEMLHVLHLLTLPPEEISHNANDPNLASRLGAERIRIADRKVQLQAVNSWLDRAGVIPPKAQAERPADLQLADMTVTELRRLAETLDGEIAERAKVVPAPELAPADSQGIDSLM